MKKIMLLIICILFLIGCKDDKVVAKKIVKEEVEQEEEKYIEYLETDALKILINECNGITGIIEIESLHEIIIEELLVVMDFEETIDSQESLIEETVYNVLNEWKHEVVRGVVQNNRVTLNRDDYEYILERTSINGAIQLMNSYEKVYLKKYY